jgi:hypothetical protein
VPLPCERPGSVTEQRSEVGVGEQRGKSAGGTGELHPRRNGCLPVDVDLLPWLAGGVDPGVD